MFCDDGRNGQDAVDPSAPNPNNLGPLYQPSCVGVFYRFAQNPDIRADQISKASIGAIGILDACDIVLFLQYFQNRTG